MYAIVIRTGTPENRIVGTACQTTVMIRAGPYGSTSPTASSTAPIFFTTVASFSLQRQPAPLPRERRLVHLDAPRLRDQQVVGVVVAVAALRVVQTRLVREHHPLDHHRRVAERHVRLLVPFHPGAVRRPVIGVALEARAAGDLEHFGCHLAALDARLRPFLLRQPHLRVHVPQLLLRLGPRREVTRTAPFPTPAAAPHPPPPQP